MWKVYHTIQSQYRCDLLDTKGMLLGECGLIKNVKYECNDPNTECLQIDKSYS